MAPKAQPKAPKVDPSESRRSTEAVIKLHQAHIEKIPDLYPPEVAGPMIEAGKTYVEKLKKCLT